MINSTFIEVSADKFHEFIMENLPKHHTSESLITELSFQKFHAINSYYGIHYVGTAANETLTYKLSVTDKKLCTFFLLKYGN